MIKKYKITGLDCPNCAKKLENEINKLNTVDSAELNFIKQTLTIKSNNQTQAFKDAVKIAHVIEPEAKIIEIKTNTKLFNKSSIANLILLLVGIMLAVVVLTVNLKTWSYWLLFILSALFMGYKTYIKAFKLLTKFIVNENLLVTLSIIGAVCVGEHMEGLMVIGLYSIGKVLENLALNRSKKSIEELTSMKVDVVYVERDGQLISVMPEDVNINEIIVVRAGEIVALDGIIVEGNVTLNQQSLTGESLPKTVKPNDEIISGSIVLDGVVKIKVTKIYSDSTVCKIMNLIENATDKKSKTETIISKIAKWYTFAVLGLSVLIFLIIFLLTKNVNVAIYRGLIFLVVSCPCAFAISVPLAYFSGIGNASKNGILIKGSNYLDALAKVNLVAFDKTGTLTTGEFEIQKIEIKNNEYTQEQILWLASLGEQFSNHPLAKSIVKANNITLMPVTNVKEIAGEGVYFNYEANTYFVGRKNENLSGTIVELYKDNVLLAEIYLSDKIKDNANLVCKNLSNNKIKTILLSGDNEQIVKTVAEHIGINEYYSNLLPQQKFEKIEEYKKEKNNIIAYVGDGINDAPSLALADVGISMGINGSSVSIESSDIVLVDDNPNKIHKAIRLSKYTRKIVWQNIILSAVIKITFLTLGALGVTGMLSAVIADVGVTVLAILNSLRALLYKNK